MPGGFKAVGSVMIEPDGKIKIFDVASSHSTLIAPGDIVTFTGTGTATTSVPQVDVSTAGQAVTGLVVGVVPNYANETLNSVGLAASTAGSLYVLCDPMAYMEVDVSNGPLAVADVGLNANLVATAATLSGGLAVSNMTLNATGKATTNTLQFRIEKLLTDSAGVLGNRALVRVNSSTYITGTSGV
jgi:hypothetical protein